MRRETGHRRARASLLALLAAALGTMGCGAKERRVEVAVQVQGDTATVAISATGIRLYRGNHAHLSLNDGPEVMLYSDRPYRFRRLPPGEYTLRVWVTDPEHRPIAGLEKVVHFKVIPSRTVPAPGG